MKKIKKEKFQSFPAIPKAQGPLRSSKLKLFFKLIMNIHALCSQFLYFHSSNLATFTPFTSFYVIELLHMFFLQVIPYKYLELYKNGSCGLLKNCLACLTDSLCGWCESTEECYLKSTASLVCQNRDGNSFLVTHPSSCTVCSDYIYCKQCTQVCFLIYFKRMVFIMYICLYISLQYHLLIANTNVDLNLSHV